MGLVRSIELYFLLSFLDKLLSHHYLNFLLFTQSPQTPLVPLH